MLLVGNVMAMGLMSLAAVEDIKLEKARVKREKDKTAKLDILKHQLLVDKKEDRAKFGE